MSAPEITLWQDLFRVIKGLPSYLVAFVGGFLVYILSDIEVTSLFLLGVTVGLAASSVTWGFAAFFIAFSIFKALGRLGDAVVHAAKIQANMLHSSASMIANSES